jgi:hypothetical protein
MAVFAKRRRVASRVVGSHDELTGRVPHLGILEKATWGEE